MAVIVAFPSANARTTPVALTVAALLDDLQLMVRPDMTVPSLSTTRAVNRSESPWAKLAEFGVTVSERALV